MAFGKTIGTVKAVLAVIAEMMESAETEIAYIVPPAGLGFTAQYSFLSDGAKKIVQKGGRVRGITDISHYHVSAARELLNIGEDLRHSGEVQKVLMFVRDRKESISSISVARQEFLLVDPLAAFWTDNNTYAEYLLSSFETAWAQSIPATERLKELAKEGPGQN
jgi:hypothetical protein